MNQFKKAQVIMLPKSGEKLQTKCNCKNPEEFHHYHCGLVEQNNKVYLNGKSINLCIVSDDELKESDWFIGDNISIKQCTLNNSGNINFKGGWYSGSTNCKKIIATTDTSLDIKTYYKKVGDKLGRNEKLPQPSQQFIEQYIESYNRGEVITDVLVEYEGEKSGCLNYKDNGGTQCNVPCNNAGWCPDNRNNLKLKINQDDTINIKLPKDSWSREEITDMLKTFCNEYRILTSVDQWVKENL